MLTRTLSTAAGGFFVLATLMGAQASAAGVSQKECSAKYQAAKAANTLNGMKYAAFRKANCGATAETTPDTTTPPATQTSTPAPTTTTTTTTPAATPSAPASAAVFPTAVSPKYASEKPGRARIHTCSDQWKINKANNTTGGMKWNKKGGGGYWPECDKRLKGAA